VLGIVSLDPTRKAGVTAGIPTVLTALVYVARARFRRGACNKGKRLARKSGWSNVTSVQFRRWYLDGESAAPSYIEQVSAKLAQLLQTQRQPEPEPQDRLLPVSIGDPPCRPL
jgi:hypothetical protein